MEAILTYVFSLVCLVREISVTGVEIRHIFSLDRGDSTFENLLSPIISRYPIAER